MKKRNRVAGLEPMHTNKSKKEYQVSTFLLERANVLKTLMYLITIKIHFNDEE